MTIDDAFREALADVASGRITFPCDPQGFPGTVHGGAVAALSYRLTLPRTPVHPRSPIR